MKNLESLTISDYLAILRRRMWYVIFTAIFVGAGTVVYVMRMPPVYKSETTIMVSGRVVPEDYIRSVDRATPDDLIGFAKQQLQSRTFLERIVQEFQLAGPETNPEVPVNSVRRNTEITVLTPTTFRLAFSATDRNLAQSVARRLAERVIQLNETFRREKVQVADQFMDAQVHQATNELAEIQARLRQFYDQHYPGLANEVVNAETLSTLRSQLATLDARLGESIADRKSSDRRLEELRQLRSVVQDTIPVLPLTLSVPTAAQGAAPVPSATEEKLAAKRAELASALTRYTPLHPEVKRLTMEVERLEVLVKDAAALRRSPEPVAQKVDAPQPAFSSVMDSSTDLLGPELQMEITRLDAEIARQEQIRKTLVRRIALYEAHLNPTPAQAQELAALNRDYESAKQRYNIFADKKVSAELAARVDASDDSQMFRVIDAASLPQFPVNTNHRVLAVAGCLAGLFIGFALSFVREFLDPSLQTEDDAAAALKLPVLISIPLVAQNRKKKNVVPKQALAAVPRKDDSPDVRVGGIFNLDNTDPNVRSVILDAATVAGEQYRLMSARLSVLHNQRKIKSLLITSAIPNDGKTFMACSLAGVLGREPGKKVLLIDADLRTGNAGKTLGLNPDSIGLSELLRSSQPLGEAGATISGESHAMAPSLRKSLTKCTDLNLYVLPAGNMVDNPADLLSSPELERLVRYAETIFDWVIIDSPPVLGLADANLIVPICGSTLLVVHAAKTPTTVAKDAIQCIGAERIAGIVMNRVHAINSVKYYGKYYQNTGQVNRFGTAR